MRINPHVKIDGEKWYQRSVEYQHEGRPFSFDIYARTDEEATEMLRSIRTTAVSHNRIMASGKCWPGCMILLSLVCRIRNFFFWEPK